MTTTIYIKGLWHQGLVAAGVWSKMGLQVVCLCDSVEEAIQLQRSEMPIFEPGLSDLIASGIENGNLSFQLIRYDLPAPNFLALMHDTEVDESDIVNTKTMFDDLNKLLNFIKADTEILITAQIPAGTTQKISELIEDCLSITPRISYMPENLRLGQGIERFECPRLPVIGISNPDSCTPLAKLFAPETVIHFCEIIEAEVLKSALNGFLALCITYGNEISEICDFLGVSGTRVMKILQIEERIGSKVPILPGLPFSGGTLGRDVQNLRGMSKTKNGVIEGIWNSNGSRKDYLVQYILDVLTANSSRSVGLVGLTYKTGTSTLRRSLAVEVAETLYKKRVEVFGFDPMFEEFDVPLSEAINLQRSLEFLIINTQIIVIMTPWPEVIDELRTLNLQNHTVIDPFGIFANEYSKFKSYFHFGGIKSL
jgi:UDPglucose 6-dehydrogenase